MSRLPFIGRVIPALTALAFGFAAPAALAQTSPAPAPTATTMSAPAPMATTAPTSKKHKTSSTAASSSSTTAPASTTAATTSGSASPMAPAAGATGKLTSAMKFTTVAAAQASCPGDTVVWSSLTKSKSFHLSTSKYYGKTKHGAYVCQQAALAAGFHQSKT